MVTLELILSALSFIGILYVGFVQDRERRALKSVVELHKERADIAEELARMKFDKISGDFLNLSKQFEMSLEKYGEVMAFAHKVVSVYDKNGREKIMDSHLPLNKSDLEVSLERFDGQID